MHPYTHTHTIDYTHTYNIHLLYISSENKQEEREQVHLSGVYSNLTSLNFIVMTCQKMLFEGRKRAQTAEIQGSGVTGKPLQKGSTVVEHLPHICGALFFTPTRKKKK